ncbi:MAG TPA: signal peptide peptidase SppA [Candidatus Saccharimonadales bacterium]|nr:signal peptide peptidase SppA [Candidatus Saccharimonadales bacterium]
MDNNVPPPPQPPVPPPLVLAPPKTSPPRPRGSSGWKVAVLLLAILLALSLLFNARQVVHGLVAVGSTRHAGPRLEESILEDNNARDKIAVIPVEGVIAGESLGRDGYTMVDYIQDQLKMAGEDEHVKAVLLKVNSPGGEVLASDDIYAAIVKFQEETEKPVITSMGSLAASGGYYVSAPSRWIVANELTITGSIGVIMHSINYRGLMDKVGLRPEVFKSGKFKDMLSGSKKETEVTEEERQMIQKLVNETFQKFKSIVAEGRKSANDSNKGSKDAKGQTLSKDWEDYADGRVLSGKEALKLGFVDELGNFDTAVNRAKKLAGISDANLVQYQQPFSLGSLFRLFGKSEAAVVKVDLGMETPKVQAGRLYFLSPTYIR